jgi:ABC-2 type transport system ATP-binding protein
MTEEILPLEIRSLEVVLSQRQILDDISLTLKKGDLMWLRGRNGAGKSTLMRALVGLLSYRGEVLIKGEPPYTLRAKSKFIYVPDEALLYDDLSVKEHARFSSMSYFQSDAEAKILGLLEQFQLTPYLDEYPTAHSRGMRQKASLSLALGLDLPLYILDEPYNALDVQAQETLSEILAAKIKSGASILVTAHQEGITRSLLERIPHARQADLEEGKLLERVTGKKAGKVLIDKST